MKTLSRSGTTSTATMMMWLGLTTTAVLAASCSSSNGQKASSGFRADAAVMTVTGPSGEMQTWVGASSSQDVEGDDDPVVTLLGGTVYAVKIEVHGSATATGEDLEWFSRWLQQGPMTVTILSSSVTGDGKGQGAIATVEATIEVDNCLNENRMSLPASFDLFTDRDNKFVRVADVAVVVDIDCDRRNQASS